MTKSARNKTIELTSAEIEDYFSRAVEINCNVGINEIVNKTILGDSIQILQFIPNNSIDLIFIDPPYNKDKVFINNSFRKLSFEEYIVWVEGWFGEAVNKLKMNGSMYVCSDWLSSSAIFMVMRKHLIVKNRITWGREKGRGAKTNWKEGHEDIWFGVKSKDYIFNVNDVKSRKTVIAPYRDKHGIPKDWEETENGKYRLTYPSNFWNDITVPFWSMSENTEHPTQKSEKLLAKIILASSNPDDVVLDFFLGSGTTSVVAKKLNRNYIGIDIDKYNVALTEKRLKLNKTSNRIQGYNGVFNTRNSS